MDLSINEKKHEKEKAILQQNIMQAVSHTLGNMLFVQKGITQNLSSSNNLENDIKRLQLFQTMTSSVLDSIKVAFGGNIDNNIEFFDKETENSIPLSSLFYFSLALNLENLLFGGQEWEKKRKNFLSINSKNRKEIFSKLYEVKDNPKFQILELSNEDILNFKNFFVSEEFNFVGKYFEINVEALNNIFIKKESYTFAIIFVIFQELIKNMFKYGSTKTNNDVIFKIIANNDKKIGLIFENRFLDSKTKNKIGTLKGLKMIEMFAKVLGGFKNNSNEEKFFIKIEIDKKFFKKGVDENLMG